MAASEGRANVIEELSLHGATIDCVDRWGGTPLRDAVRGRHLRAANLLMERGGTLGFTEKEAANELNHLARRGKLEVLKLMVKAGVPVNVVDYDGRSCLHLASSEGNLPIVRHLIESAKGMKLNIADRWGGTPLS